jgi:hypothetical protein
LPAITGRALTGGATVGCTRSSTPDSRILARRDGAGVRLITRHGNDFTWRFPLAAAVSSLPACSFLIAGDGLSLMTVAITPSVV